jgi:hypothetical protein
MSISSVYQIFSAVDGDYESFYLNTDWQLGSGKTAATSKENVLDILCDNLELNKEFSQSQHRAKDNVYEGEENAVERSTNCLQAAVKRPKERKKTSPKKRNGEKKPSNIHQERKKSVKERNKEAAQWYRLRKRIRSQEVKEELELLKKRYAALEEELRSLKATLHLGSAIALPVIKEISECDFY